MIHDWTQEPLLDELLPVDWGAAVVLPEELVIVDCEPDGALFAVVLYVLPWSFTWRMGQHLMCILMESKERSCWPLIEAAIVILVGCVSMWSFYEVERVRAIDAFDGALCLWSASG